MNDMTIKTRIEKLSVCDRCFSVGITDSNCMCVYGSHSTIDLEFEVCDCCGNLIEDGRPADTEFNRKQLNDEEN